MSEELKYYKTDNQNNYGWNITWEATGRFPIIAKRSFKKLEDAQHFVDYDGTACKGLILAVFEDPKDTNNGIYLVQSISSVDSDNNLIPGVLVKAGSGAGSITTSTYSSAISLATADNIGQIIYVTTDEIIYTYMDGDEKKTISSLDAATYEEDFVDGKTILVYYDADGKKLFSSNDDGAITYAAGPYIVTGAQSLAKLGTTSASGDLASDVSNLQGRVGTLETETIKDVYVKESSLDAELQGTSAKLITASRDETDNRKVTLTPVIGKLKLDGTIETEGLATVTNVKNYVDDVFAWEEVETIATTTPAPNIPGQ